MKEEQNCVNKILFKNYYNNFYNLKIILSAIYKDTDKIFNFMQKKKEPPNIFQ